MDSVAMRRKAAELEKQAKEKAVLAAKEERLLTAEENEDIEKLRTEAKEWREQADQLDAISAGEAELKKSVGERPLITGRPNFEDDPRRGYKTPRQFLMEVMAVGQGKRLPSENLRSLKPHKHPEDEEFAAGSDEAGGYSDAYGGFLLPVGFSPDLLSIEAEEDPMRGVTQIPMDKPIVSINARVDKDHSTSVSGGLRVYRRSETQSVTAARMQFEQIEMRAHGLLGVSYASEELLIDSVISFIALLEAGFRDEFSAKLLEERLNGTGVGQFLGINSAACKVDIAKESGQTDKLVAKNIVKMFARCWGRNNAVWGANHDVLPYLMTLTLPVGAGGVAIPLWQPSFREGAPSTLLGLPIVFSERFESAGTVGDLVLGNWSQYLEGVLEELKSGESMHVRFVEHERAIKFWMRNAGAPWWKTILTPKRGSTMAPFVRLATR